MTTSPPALHDSPTILLATLFAARRSGDDTLTRLVARRLALLGIKVQFADSLGKPAGRKAVSGGR